MLGDIDVGKIDVEKILVFTPHPDDAEIASGGAMARWASEGKEIVLCVVTNGAMGSNDPSVARADLVTTRQLEQEHAASILGIKDVVFLGYEDGAVEDSHELRRDMIREIRRHKPDLVVGPDPTTYYVDQFYLNHPDHRRVGEAFLAAVNPGATTVPLYRSELYDQGYLPHQVKGCLLSFSLNADYVVDITPFVDAKIQALRAHASQLGAWGELETFVRGLGQRMAAMSGGEATYAEAFKAFSFGELGGAPFGIR